MLYYISQRNGFMKSRVKTTFCANQVNSACVGICDECE